MGMLDCDWDEFVSYHQVATSHDDKMSVLGSRRESYRSDGRSGSHVPAYVHDMLLSMIHPGDELARLLVKSRASSKTDLD